MLLCSSLPLDFELTPPQFIDHDYLILRILYQELGQDSRDTIFARCERKPDPVSLGGNQFHTQTWDSVSFSSDLDRIHNQDKCKAISLLHLENVEVRHVALLLYIIRENAGKPAPYSLSNSRAQQSRARLMSFHHEGMEETTAH